MGIPLSIQLEPFRLDSKEWEARCFKDEKIVDHPEYYFPDGNFIVVVDNKAFNLYRGILQRHSFFFEDPEICAFRCTGDMKVEEFAILCQFIFPKEIGAIPDIQAGDFDKWRRILRSTVELRMSNVRNYILNKLAEDQTVVTTKAVDFLYWIQDEDETLEKLLLQCIQVLAYRLSPLSTEDARGLSGTRANQVALARERVRSLFYNPNYWKVRIPNTLCRAPGHHCSDGVFLAMAKQMSLSSKPTKPNSELDLLQIAVGSMCEVCSRRYAGSVKQNVNLEIRKCLGHADESESSDSNPLGGYWMSWLNRKT